METIYIFTTNKSNYPVENPKKETLESFAKRYNLDMTSQVIAVTKFMDSWIADKINKAAVDVPDYFIGTETEWAAHVLQIKWEAQMHDFLSNGGQVEISQLANDLFSLFKEDVTTDAQTPITVKVTGTDHTVETHNYTINQAFLEGLKHEVKNATTRIRVALGMVTKQHAGNYTSNPHLEAVVKSWHDKMIADPVLSSEITSIKTIFADAKLHSILDYYRTTSKVNSVEAHIKSLIATEILK